ncbi:hypothetical protein, partial [Treponema socranskii]
SRERPLLEIALVKSGVEKRLTRFSFIGDAKKSCALLGFFRSSNFPLFPVYYFPLQLIEAFCVYTGKSESGLSQAGRRGSEVLAGQRYV